MGDVIPLSRRAEPPTAQPRAVEPRAGQPRPVEPLWRESVGRQLRRERHAAERRLVDVAREAGVSPQYLSEVERGLKDPSSELLAAMAGALGLSIADLVSRVVSAGMSQHTPRCLAA